MSIELVMVDMEDGVDAANILLRCASLMPDGFFSRLAIVFPPTGHQFPANVDHIKCAFQKGNMFGYNVWLVREFPRFIMCDYCLTMHRDGYLLNPDKWTDEFLQYDYIGAPWDHQRNGGNGAFCLQSKRFANWYSRHPFPIEDGIPQDNYICEIIQGTARAAGFKYAPVEVAARFSLEWDIPEFPRTLEDVFGFHGKWHLR